MAGSASHKKDRPECPKEPPLPPAPKPDIDKKPCLDKFKTQCKWDEEEEKDPCAKLPMSTTCNTNPKKECPQGPPKPCHKEDPCKKKPPPE